MSGTATGEGDPRRRASRERVLAALREGGALSRAELARRTALSRATVSSIVAELHEAALVVEDEAADERERPGRPASVIRLDPAAGAALGIDFGKRHVRVALADLGHRILAERSAEIDSDHRADDGMALACRLVDEVLREAGVPATAVLGAGMGVPGPINAISGRLGSSTILPGWVGVDAHEAMSARLGLEVHVDNDANLGALAEWTWGAARGCADVAYLKVATGIGAGLILGGQLFRGAGGTAGEIGHTIIDPGGPVCRCGNRGCLETIVGGPALLALLEPALGPVTMRDVLDRAGAGDQACRRVIADAGTAIGAAAANLCNLFNPGRIVVGGDLGAAGDVLLDPLRAALDRAAIPSAAADVEVVAGVLGERAEVLGAIALVLRGRGAANGLQAIARGSAEASSRRERMSSLR